MTDDILPLVGVIGTGGTIASVGAGPFDLRDYPDTGLKLDAGSLVERTGLDGVVVRIVAKDFRSIDSTAITPDDWHGLAQLCETMASENPDMAGIVVAHGTASLEETAYALSLVHALPIPVVVTGAMRPTNGISSDGPANLAAALRVAAAGRNGVHVVMDGDIHSPAEVLKADTMRLDAFVSRRGRLLGEIDGATVRWHRPTPAFGGFAWDLLGRLPRVDIAFSHVGADGCAIRAFVQAGAQGIVSAGFGPGMATPAETEAMAEAVQSGVAVVQAFRGGGGRVVATTEQKAFGIVASGDLAPQKARILLALCLARGDDADRIRDAFYSA
ncbi:MAG: asparaginase [Rhizobiaceae bacterium]